MTSQSAGLGAGVACAGLAFLFISAVGFGHRKTRGGRELAETSAADRSGVPFANRGFYQMKWAPAMAGIGVILLLAGAIWFFAAGG